MLLEADVFGGCCCCGCCCTTPYARLLCAESSPSATHSSVRLRHTLSALRRSWRSVTAGLGPPTALAAPEMGPGSPGWPIIPARAIASVAADSRARKMSWFRNGFDLDRADTRTGYASFWEGTTVPVVSVVVLAPLPLLCEATSLDRLGDDEAVVAVVVAVGGRSSVNLDTAAPEVGGSLPVSSRRWMRDLRSSSSSHTVEGAVFDVVDSVPSGPWLLLLLLEMGGWLGVSSPWRLAVLLPGCQLKERVSGDEL